jgi:hypothetical protein
MITVSVDTSGLQAKVDELRGPVKARVMDRFFKRMAIHGEALMKLNAPVRKQSYGPHPNRGGGLRASIDSTIRPDGATIQPHKDYAVFVEMGTRPHTITGNPWLVFYTANGRVMTHSVSHPGTAPNRFAKRTRDMLQDIAPTMMGEIIEAETAGLR